MAGVLYAATPYGLFTFVLITLILGGLGAWAAGRALGLARWLVGRASMIKQKLFGIEQRPE